VRVTGKIVALAVLVAGCQSTIYGVTSVSWLDDGHLLVAGPTFGVAKITCDGTVEQQWRSRDDTITGVCALSSEERCLVVSARDRVRHFGDTMPEMYWLDLRDSSMTRITNDKLDEQLLCRTGDVVWICRSRLLDAGGALLAPSRAFELDQFNSATGEWTRLEVEATRFFNDGGPQFGANSAAALPDGTGVICSHGLTSAGASTISTDGRIIDNDDPYTVQSQREGFRVRCVTAPSEGWHTHWWQVIEGVDLTTGVTRTVFHDDESWRVEELQVSPDGKFLSFLESGGNSNTHLICIVDLDSKRVTKVLMEIKYGDVAPRGSEQGPSPGLNEAPHR
jgi:hypothetical protein